MQQTKRLLSFLLLLLVVAIVSIAGTLAYLTDRQDVTAVLEFGEIKVQLSDPGYQSNVRLVPGTQAPTTPQISNVGTVDCYVRATITISASGSENLGSEPFQRYVTFHHDNSNSNWDWSGSNYDPDSSDPIVIYYKKPLGTQGDDKVTQPIYNTIEVLSEVNGTPLLEGVNDNFRVSVDISAVQTVHNGQLIETPQEAFQLLEAL